jgi:hypothetical protein
MGKHTPWPWFVTGNMTKYVESRIGGGMIQEVAACGPTDADNGYGEQQEANARLIAAAPELLESLDNVLRSAPSSLCCADFNHWKGDYHGPDDKCPPLERFNSALICAGDVIAKAKGESN